MSDWVRPTKKHDFASPNLPEKTGIWVSGAIPKTETERPKIMLEERSDNPGYSLSQAGILGAAIRSVSDDLGIKTEEADWYVVGEDDHLYALEVEDKLVWQPSEQWNNLVRSGELSIHEEDHAKEAFPDEQARVVSADRHEMSFHELHDIIEAFGINEASPDTEPMPEQNYMFDLADESFSQDLQIHSQEHQQVEQDHGVDLGNEI
ncbi:hypothetical protein LBMAG21_00190 [Armatimonadota bacterium]|nr:hypothetical protein LBMAG21_00190 [Armatimonadota bacterium]